MPAIDQVAMQAFVTAGQTAPTTSAKGKALEDMICYLFGLVPGIEVTERNEMNVFLTEEIDVAFWNAGATDGLSFLPNILLVECKNWSNAVSSMEVAWFDTKLRHRGQDFGILVALNGITGNADEITRAHQTVAAALLEKRRLIVLTVPQLLALGTTDDLVLLIKKKLCQLAVRGAIA